MARPSIQVTRRTQHGKNKSRQLRADHKIPAVVYGKGKEPLTVTVDPKAVVAILHSPLGRNTPLTLEVEGESSGRLALIKDFQVHPVKRRVLHVDFWDIDEDKDLTLKVPFRRTGRAEAERRGARVRLTRDDVVISCKPANVPAAIEYDMSGVTGESVNVHISEVQMPEGVTAVYKHDYSIVQMFMPRAKAEEATKEAAAAV